MTILSHPEYVLLGVTGDAEITRCAIYWWALKDLYFCKPIGARNPSRCALWYHTHIAHMEQIPAQIRLCTSRFRYFLEISLRCKTHSQKYYSPAITNGTAPRRTSLKTHVHVAMQDKGVVGLFPKVTCTSRFPLSTTQFYIGMTHKDCVRRVCTLFANVLFWFKR